MSVIDLGPYGTAIVMPFEPNSRIVLLALCMSLSACDQRPDTKASGDTQDPDSSETDTPSDESSADSSGETGELACGAIDSVYYFFFASSGPCGPQREVWVDRRGDVTHESQEFEDDWPCEPSVGMQEIDESDAEALVNIVCDDYNDGHEDAGGTGSGCVIALSSEEQELVRVNLGYECGGMADSVEALERFTGLTMWP